MLHNNTLSKTIKNGKHIMKKKEKKDLVPTALVSQRHAALQVSGFGESIKIPNLSSAVYL